MTQGDLILTSPLQADISLSGYNIGVSDEIFEVLLSFRGDVDPQVSYQYPT